MRPGRIDRAVLSEATVPPVPTVVFGAAEGGIQHHSMEAASHPITPPS